MPPFLAFLFLFFLAAAPATAQAAHECPPFAEPDVAIEITAAQPILNTEMPLASLQAMAASSGKKNFSSTNHEVSVGLTAASIDLDSNYQIRTRTRSDDPMICAQVAGLRLRFGFRQMTVYLANELTPGSCGFRTVLEHEMRHVQTDKAFVEAYAHHLPSLLKEAIAEIGVIRAGSQEAAEEKIRLLISAYMHDLSAGLSAVREKQQRQIDTPEEYARLSRSCDNELAVLIYNHEQNAGR